MDDGNGSFLRFAIEELDDLRKKYPKSKGVFRVGEELEIRGSKFRVKEISPFGIKLKLLIWAANRIQEGEKAIAELERLKESRSEALRISSEILEQAEQERLDAE